MPQIYTVQIEEFNGAREYTHDIYVAANSQAEAEEWALAYAADFYDDAERTDMGDEGLCWEVEGGGLLYCLRSVKPDNTLLIYDTQGSTATARLVLAEE
ncbi:MAG: hypothetical protein JXA21_10485 [Anaerolineae bacterium]|nr:hypothetical protein [Anaerolineae bacterium]